MTCAGAAPLLAAAADGLLDDERHSALAAHLSTCTACRAALDDQIAVRAWLSRTPDAPMPPAFGDRVNARIDASDGLLGVADFRAWTLRLAPLAALLALAAWLGIGGVPSSPSPTAASAASSLTTFTPSRQADWQRTVSGNALLQAALFPSRSGERDVR